MEVHTRTKTRMTGTWTKLIISILRSTHDDHSDTQNLTSERSSWSLWCWCWRWRRSRWLWGRRPRWCLRGRCDGRRRSRGTVALSANAALQSNACMLERHRSRFFCCITKSRSAAVKVVNSQLKTKSKAKRMKPAHVN